MAGKNGNDPKLIEILGIDTGFSSVKVADDEGKTFRFPNHVVEHDPDLLDIGFGQSKDVVIEIEGLGAKNVGCPPRNNNFSKDDRLHGSEKWHYLVCRALWEAFEGRKGLDTSADTSALKVSNLVFGLPIHQKTPEKETELQRFNKFSFTVNGTPYHVEVEKILVLPQGVPMLALDFDIEDSESCAIIDIGHHTLDLALYDREDFVRDKCISMPHGMKFIHDKLGRAIFNRCKSHPGAYRLEMALKERGFKYGTWVPLGKEIDQIVKAYWNLVKEDLFAIWEQDLAYIDHAIIGGGGAHLLEKVVAMELEEFKGAPVKIHVVDNPIFGNATSYVQVVQGLLANG